MAVPGDPSAAGILRSVPGAFIRGHESLRDPRQEGHHHAKGRPACEEDPRRLGRAGVDWKADGPLWVRMSQGESWKRFAG